MSSISSVTNQHNCYQQKMSSQIKTVISTMDLVMQNLSRTITTQIHFAINITNKIRNFQIISGNYNTKGINFTLKWKIAAYTSTCRCGSRRCELCLTETYVTARADQKNLLSKTPELIAKCQHRNRYILKISNSS